MNTIILTKTKYKKDKTKIENTLITYNLRKINNTTYLGKITKEDSENIKKELEIINQQQDTIIIIPLCKRCYNNITQYGKTINLKQEKYVIL